MTERLADWDHDQFKKIIVKVANMEIAYKAIAFYLDRQVSLSEQVKNHVLIPSPNSYPTSSQP
jgi:hypothetical protein